MTIHKARRKRATKAERSVAQDLGGRRVFLSGAGDDKADVTTPRAFKVIDGDIMESTHYSFRVEVKTTEHASYRFCGKDWWKLVQAADRYGQTPLFVMHMAITQLRFSAVAMTKALHDELFGLVEIDGIEQKSLKVDRALVLSDPIQYVTFAGRRPANVLHLRNQVFIRQYADLVTRLAEIERS